MHISVYVWKCLSLQGRFCKQLKGLFRRPPKKSPGLRTLRSPSTRLYSFYPFLFTIVYLRIPLLLLLDPSHQVFSHPHEEVPPFPISPPLGLFFSISLGGTKGGWVILIDQACRVRYLQCRLHACSLTSDMVVSRSEIIWSILPFLDFRCTVYTVGKYHPPSQNIYYKIRLDKMGEWYIQTVTVY